MHIPHISLETHEAITKLVWTVLPQQPYSPDLATSGFHLFLDHLKKHSMAQVLKMRVWFKPGIG